jgi:polyferredoxin
MDIERETIAQIAISAIAFATFIAASVFVSLTYSANDHLTQQGGVAIIGAIGLFVVVMLGAGIWMERQEF